MARNLSPALRRELENLDKDAGSRKSAMKALKSYVKDLDSKAIPVFLAQVSVTKDVGSSSGEYTISLYEVLARVHGPNIVSYIDIIMGTVIRNLATSGGPFPLQQACSKVASAIARYAIEPTTPEDKKKHIIHSLCKPLSDSLLVAQESLSCGAALCLKALVDCDNWRFASDDMVNEVCVKLAGALKDKTTQTNSHMGLVMSLAKHNSLIVEAYAGMLIQSGLEILNAGATERNSQKRLTAIQMINFLMKCLDVRSIYSELELIIEEMEKCQSDELPYVRGAAFEALQTARKLMANKGLKVDADVVSVTGSNFGWSGKSSGKYQLASRDESPASVSPHSQTLDSFPANCSFTDSPISASQASCNLDHNRKNVSRKLWSYENGGVNISLKDGIFSQFVNNGGSHALSEHREASDSRRSYGNGFHGFYPGTPTREGFRSQTPSPQRVRPQINSGTVNIYSTPRKLVRSLQDEECENSDIYQNQVRNLRSPCSVKCRCSPVAKYSSNSLADGVFRTNKMNGNLTDRARLSESNSESVSSTEDIPTDEQITGELSWVGDEHNKLVKRGGVKTTLNVLCSILLLLFAVFVSILWLGDERKGSHLIPT